MSEEPPGSPESPEPPQGPPGPPGVSDPQKSGDGKVAWNPIEGWFRKNEKTILCIAAGLASISVAVGMNTCSVLQNNASAYLAEGVRTDLRRLEDRVQTLEKSVSSLQSEPSCPPDLSEFVEDASPSEQEQPDEE